MIERLQAEGYTVYAPPNPLRSLQGDSQTIADFLKTITGPIVLVGHSYGGAVITNASNGIPNVKALVYVDAFAPAKGESAFELTGKFPGSVLTSAPTSQVFRAVSYPGAPKGDALVYVNPSFFMKGFANDLSAKEGAVAEATQNPVTLSAVEAPSGAPAWKHIRSWDVVGTIDQAIPEAAQLFIGQAGPRAYHRGASGPSVHGLSAWCGGEGHHRGRPSRRQDRRSPLAATVCWPAGRSRPAGRAGRRCARQTDSDAPAQLSSPLRVRRAWC